MKKRKLVVPISRQYENGYTWTFANNLGYR